MNSKTIICFIFSIMTVFLKLCAAEKIKVCRKIFVYKQKAIESWSTDDLCLQMIYAILSLWFYFSSTKICQCMKQEKFVDILAFF